MNNSIKYLKNAGWLSLIVSALLINGIAQAVLDRVLVIVNEDVITQSEFDYRIKSILDDLKTSGTPIPEDLPKQLLETMVSDRLQVQEANRRGITIPEQDLNETMQRFAERQGVTVEELKAQVEASGQPYKMFRESVRDSMTISRFTDYYARSRVVVPDYEIETLINGQNLDQDTSEYEIARILIKNSPESDAVAEQVRKEISEGLSFEEAAQNFSDSTDAQEGGVIGWRSAAQLPEVYLTVLKDMQAGDVSPVVKTPNGLHILKLLDLKSDRTEIVQSKVRHILISADSRVAKSQAAKKLVEIRQRIIDGESFDALARIFSDDSVSAANGGNLGWVSPGTMVPPFEQAYERMPLNEVSQPIETQFGMHILVVEDRRKKNITDQIIRGRAEQMLRRQRADREYKQWIRELLEGAYVEYVAEPEMPAV